MKLTYICEFHIYIKVKFILDLFFANMLPNSSKLYVDNLPYILSEYRHFSYTHKIQWQTYLIYVYNDIVVAITHNDGSMYNLLSETKVTLQERNVIKLEEFDDVPVIQMFTKFQNVFKRYPEIDALILFEIYLHALCRRMVEYEIVEGVEIASVRKYIFYIINLRTYSCIDGNVKLLHLDRTTYSLAKSVSEITKQGPLFNYDEDTLIFALYVYIYAYDDKDKYIFAGAVYYMLKNVSYLVKYVLLEICKFNRDKVTTFDKHKKYIFMKSVHVDLSYGMTYDNIKELTTRTAFSLLKPLKYQYV